MGLISMAPVLCVVVAVASGAAGAQDRPSLSWSSDAIPWQRAAPTGTKYALLEGSRERVGGLFTYAFFIPAGVWDSPHWHSTTARVFVAKGALGIGFGDHADRSRIKTYAAGDYLIVPAGSRHYDGADVDTIIIGVATGPWSTTYVDGSKPASAGTPLPAAR